MSVRGSIHSFAKEKEMPDLKRPVPTAASVLQVFIEVAMQVCRKIVFFDVRYRVSAYFFALFLLSAMADALPIPKSYFSATNNVINTYFVKLGWFWTLVLATPFICLTSSVYCCRRREMVIKHLMRLLVATATWYTWVSLFIYIERNHGRCIDKPDKTNKELCSTSGYRWKGFDVSGHSFILIYSTLVLIEESRPIIGWESIKNFIREEVYYRVKNQTSRGPFRDLSTEDFLKLQSAYNIYLPYVRLLFVLITVLTVIWDLMLLSTVFYFHSMAEKLFGGAVALGMWYITYYVIFRTSPNFYVPGEGLVKYTTPETNSAKKNGTASRKSSTQTFMGMPLAPQPVTTD